MRGRWDIARDEATKYEAQIGNARMKLDQALHDAFVGGLYQVRVVHGKGGTGILRQEVRRTLDNHPLVKSYRPGGRGEGGAGVTVVELAEK